MTLVGALVAYLLSHAVRAGRLAVLLGSTATSPSRVVAVHAATAPLGLVPFKVGELGRIAAIGAVSGGPLAGVRAVWIERAFDAATLAAVGLLALALLAHARDDVLPVVLVSVVFIAITFVALAVLPENVRMLKSFVIRRYTTDASLRALGALHAIGGELSAARRLVDGKLATLAALTAAVWALEGLAAAVFLGSAEGSVSQALGALSALFVPGATDAFRPSVVLPGVLGLGAAGVALWFARRG